MLLQALLLVFSTTLVVGNYTCSENGCHECIGNTCNLSCLGAACSDCPNGDCCNGENCNVCISSICCSTFKCNQCVHDNRRRCSTDSCNRLLEGKCGLKSDQLAGNALYNIQPHNITTIIRLHNLINNTNTVDVPINLNFTSFRDIVLNQTGVEIHPGTSLNRTTGQVYPSILNLRSLQSSHRKKPCCSIVHPEECHQVSNLPNKICFTRKHTECSDLCENVTNIFIKADPSVKSHCIIIAVHPFYYCGYYTVEDCSICYNCDSQTQIECLDDSNCSSTCKSSVLPRRFYNVPYIKRSHKTNNTDNTRVPYVQK